MLTFKNFELSQSLIQIEAFDSKTGQVISGLLTEKISLGLKRKLQKIQGALIEKYKEYQKNIEGVEAEAKLNDWDEATKTKEFIELAEEEVTIDLDHADIKFIEAIETSHNYSFALIEKFAK
jgi:hypothetical protein